jgi:prepilin-type N-terminal cleavage/methylation domain-containing protein
MKRRKAFTLVEIMIVVTIIGLLATIAIPSFLKARTTSQKNACINNLRQIDAAKAQWALETNQAPTATPVAGDLDDYIKYTTSLDADIYCPADSSRTFTSSYTINPLTANPVCQIDATNHAL